MYSSSFEQQQQQSVWRRHAPTVVVDGKREKECYVISAQMSCRCESVEAEKEIERRMLRCLLVLLILFTLLIY